MSKGPQEMGSCCEFDGLGQPNLSFQWYKQKTFYAYCTKYKGHGSHVSCSGYMVCKYILVFSLNQAKQYQNICALPF